MISTSSSSRTSKRQQRQQRRRKNDHLLITRLWGVTSPASSCSLSVSPLFSSVAGSSSELPIDDEKQKKEDSAEGVLEESLVAAAAAAETAAATPSSTGGAPATFRDAEVIGLKCMQQGDYKGALEAFELGLTLPGSKLDIIRTPVLSKSPVGGGVSAFTTKEIMKLDQFELQAAYYNMGCAHAQLGNNVPAVDCLRTALGHGFDNFGTVRNDPDLDPIRNDPLYEELMEEYDKKRRFNPFGWFTSGGSG